MVQLVTASLAIFGSILVLFLSKAFLDPLYELRKSIGEVRFNPAFHGATIHTPAARSPDASDKAKEALMKSSSDLLAKSHAILFYVQLGFLFRLPSRDAIEKAAEQLRGLSTYVHEPESKPDNSDIIRRRVEAIEKLLDLKPLEVSWPLETGQVAKRESLLGAAVRPKVRHDQYSEETRS